ncbi:hypothetical protein NONO_c15010 [Nocardia nova SH22a]|uniref:Uncharacterized protein n=1 Tax=Nocardia nova SH22a TaxID=1415166 RepID=W5TAS0_9NOCA|nr:hypothetical protein NONO_c15010 [Nocardia nova SH22a]
MSVEDNLGDPVRLLLVAADARVRAAFGATIALEPDLELVGESADAAGVTELAARTAPAAVLIDTDLLTGAAGRALAPELHAAGCAVIAFSSTSVPVTPAAGPVIYADNAGDVDAVLAVLRAAARPGGR